MVINDPKNLEYVLKNEGIFSKGDLFKSRSWDLFGRSPSTLIDIACDNDLIGHGIINADGEKWKVQRKAGLNFLSTSNLKILMDVALPGYLNETVGSLKSLELDQIVDLETVFLELTTQLMGTMAYDVSA